MLRVLQMILRRAPLFTGILIVWLVLTVLSITGRAGGAYEEYDTDHGRLPGLSIVMRGLHDHVMPWSAPSGKSSISGEDDISGKENKDADDIDEEDTDLSSEDEKDGEKKEQEDKAEGSTDKAEKTEDTDSAGKKESASEDDQSGSGAETDSSKKEDGTQKDAEKADDSVKEKSSDKEKSNDKTEDSQKADSSKTDSKESGSRVLKIPDNSTCPVVPAKDYGVADQQYLSPEDTVYNTDTEGLFAPNGTYYSLQQVGDTYFSDALFVGDSRTVGLFEYGNMSSFTSFLARESTTVYALFNDNEKMEYNPKGKKMTERTLKDLLSKAKFKKIYLSVGVNELGIPDTVDYYKEFRKVIRKIHKLQPDAIIYIQGIMHVSKKKSSSDRVFNNKAIVQRNQAISTLANGRNIFYIDMNAEVCDKDGNLREELTGDGIHLKASACEIWHTFLKNHAAVVSKKNN